MTFDKAAEKPQGQQIVYIRPVSVSDLPADLQEQAEGLETLYAIGSADGEQLALVRDRNMAFMVARQNDCDPVSVH